MCIFCNKTHQIQKSQISLTFDNFKIRSTILCVCVYLCIIKFCRERVSIVNSISHEQVMHWIISHLKREINGGMILKFCDNKFCHQKWTFSRDCSLLLKYYFHLLLLNFLLLTPTIDHGQKKNHNRAIREAIILYQKKKRKKKPEKDLLLTNLLHLCCLYSMCIEGEREREREWISY